MAKRLLYALPLAAAAAAAAALLWPLFAPEAAAPEPEPRNAAFDYDRPTEARQARRSVAAEGNFAYSLAAALAVLEDEGDAAAIRLQRPKVELALSDGSLLSALSRRGEVDVTGKALRLEDKVRVDRTSQTRLETASLMLDLEERRSWTNKPTRISGPDWTLEAGGGMRAWIEAERFLFYGPVRLTLAADPEKLMRW